ncbi:hypothetical protein B0H10DRAFT_2445844 [Mycena sp. CBHHK59/15]|nr:hypothetical protein B0H10DRAFT_2445844 [Mycena sp. CBHHK59/15]
MSFVNFAAQEPVNYGRQHRKPVPTARIETHNEIQAQKENRRKRRTAKQGDNTPQPAQYPEPRPLHARGQPSVAAPTLLPPPPVGSMKPSSVTHHSQMHVPNARMAASDAPVLQPGGLHISARNDHQGSHFTHQLDQELEPRTNFGHPDASFDDAERYEMGEDPDADQSGEGEGEGSDEERNSCAISIDEGLHDVAGSADDQITSTPVNIAVPQRTLVRRSVNHSTSTIPTPSPTIAYHTPEAPTVPYATNPRQLVRRTHIMTAATSSSSPTPAPTLKRPFTEVEDGRDDRDRESDGDDDDDDKDDNQVINVAGPGRAADLPPARRRIFDLAAIHMRLSVISEAPYGDGIQIDKLAVAAWYSSYKTLRETHGYLGTSPPTYDELALLKKRVHQVKGTFKTVARDVVLSKKGYNFKQENTPEAIAYNRQLVTDLIKRDSFIFRDPKNRNLPGSLFEHAAIQELLNRVFYNDEGSSDAILVPEYFENGLPDKALAVIVNALHCVITEFQTGERVKGRMSAKAWQPTFEKHLRTIQDWKVFTTNSGSNLTRKLQIRLIQNARQYAKVDITPNGTEAAAISTSDFAANDA